MLFREIPFLGGDLRRQSGRPDVPQFNPPPKFHAGSMPASVFTLWRRRFLNFQRPPVGILDVV